MVLLHEDRVVQPAAVAHPSAGPHGGLLELAQSRRGLARVEDARARALHGLHVARRERRDAGEPPEEVERHALAGEDRGGRAADLGEHARLAPLALGRANLEAERVVHAARTPPAPRPGPPPRRAARCSMRARACAPSGTTARVVRSPAPRSSASARPIRSVIARRWRAARCRRPHRRRPRRASRARAAPRPASRAVRGSARGALGGLLLLVDDAPDLGVDQLLRGLRDRLGAGQQRALAVLRSHGEKADLLAHAPALTIPRAMRVTCWMSDSAPVVDSPKTSSSAARPPSDTRIFARSSCSE